MKHPIQYKGLRAAQLALMMSAVLMMAACAPPNGELIYPEFLGVSTQPIQPDPPCNAAGYFTSNTPGKYYRCVWNSSTNRFIRYIYSCPSGQNFDQASQKCR